MGYAFQNFDPKSMVRIAGRNLPISTKASIEIANAIKGKQIDKAAAFLEAVIAKKQPVPYYRNVKDIPHRKAMAAGRFPVKASQHIFKLIKSLRANAQNKGLDTSKLYIIHAAAHKGPILLHYGRRRTHRKNTHFEMVAKEVEKKEKKNDRARVH